MKRKTIVVIALAALASLAAAQEFDAHEMELFKVI